MKRLLQLAAAFAAFAIPALVAVAPPPSTASGAEAPPLIQSPPLYALRGSVVDVTALPTGRPAAMTLLGTPMRPQGDGSWVGRIPPGAVRYRAEAIYADGHVERSYVAQLTYVDHIVDRVAKPFVDAGSRLASLRIGPDVGSVSGDQSARILPASFDIDGPSRRIDVLDTVRSRVVSVAFGGRITGATPIVTGSVTAGDIVRTGDGTRYLLDVTRGELIRWTQQGQDVTGISGVRNLAANTRLDVNGTSVFVRESSQGRREDLLDAITPPTVVGVQVEPTSVLFGGVCATCRDAIRVGFGRDVFDVAESEVDGHGVVWALVDVDDGRSAATQLVSIDATEVLSRTVDASTFGDVTRRLVPLDGGGVVVMSSSADELIFTQYGTSS